MLTTQTFRELHGLVNNKNEGKDLYKLIYKTHTKIKRQEITLTFIRI